MFGWFSDLYILVLADKDASRGPQEGKAGRIRRRHAVHPHDAIVCHVDPTCPVHAALLREFLGSDVAPFRRGSIAGLPHSARITSSRTPLATRIYTTPASDNSAARWQRTKRPGEISCSAGASVRQRSTANGHRGWK